MKSRNEAVFRTGIRLLVAGILFGTVACTPNPAYRKGKPDDRMPPHRERSSTDDTKETGRPPADTRRGDSLDEVIDGWLGTPYQYGGTSHGGVDCSGYVRAVVREVYNIELPRTSIQQYGEGISVGRRNLRRGDLLFFNFDRETVHHVGIYLGSGLFTHSTPGRGVVIEDFNQRVYQRAFVGAKRIVTGGTR